VIFVIFKYCIDFQDLHLCCMVLIEHECLTWGNSLVLCKANVIFCSKMWGVSRKNNCRLADVQQAASVSIQHGAGLLLVAGRAHGGEKKILCN